MNNWILREMLAMEINVYVKLWLGGTLVNQLKNLN